ncbi:competence protein CoiA family protein [Companilactobacillus sp. HBUAS56257]|uniref:competence protein CoiA family protein n=1 Tax=Companilactobacillus sp. HBUAS56257 TaxID=3109360 RepID=UPI002FEEC0EF
MYAALNESGSLIVAKEANSQMDYYCCDCHQKVKLITTASRKYFRHKNKNNNEINERDIHLQGKQILISLLKLLKPKKLLEEFYLPSIQQRPDILMNQTVFEYQCARINAKTLNDRIEGYQTLNLKSIWVLGGHYLNRKLTKEHLKFINYSQMFGYFILMLDSNQNRLILYHHIYFLGPFNKIYYQKKYFQKDNLFQLFVFHPQKPETVEIKMNEYLIGKLRHKLDAKSQKIKMRFYLNNQQTVEEFLLDQNFLAEAPIYKTPAWQRRCGEKTQLLLQPSLRIKKSDLYN